MTADDIAIIGAGPGGLACALKAVEFGLCYILLEKGQNAFQGIIDSYPRGKKVYPAIPKGDSGPFPIEELMPDENNKPVEDYLVKIETCIEKHKIDIRPGEEFSELSKNQRGFSVVTRENQYQAANVILAFGSNISVDLGVYGEAKTVARKLENPADHIGAPTLFIGGGNAAADVVATLSKTKRDAADATAVYWDNRLELSGVQALSRSKITSSFYILSTIFPTCCFFIKRD